jgi:hypothetical protein
MPDEINFSMQDYLHTQPTLEECTKAQRVFYFGRLVDSYRRKMLFSDRIPEQKISTAWVFRAGSRL